MSDEDATPRAHAAGTADSSPSQENSVHVLNGKDLAISLDNISNNMAKMASTLAKLYDPDTEERSSSLKRKSTSDIPDFSDSDSEGTSRQSGKRKHYESQTEDNLSLHASGDEVDDENDIQRLTERLKATGQKERENTAEETKFLQDFANSYDEDDATRGEIQKKLADVAQKRWDKKLSSEKFKVWSKSTNNLITALT